MPRHHTLQKITLVKDWGVGTNPTGTTALHGRIYKTSTGSHLFVSAMYDGNQLTWRIWECNPLGRHGEKPQHIKSDITINEFLDYCGYANTEPHNKPPRVATYMHSETSLDNNKRVTHTTTYHITPALHGTNTIFIETHELPHGGSYSRVSYIDRNQVEHCTDSIGWSTDSQRLHSLNITIQSGEHETYTYPVRELLQQAMLHADDTNPAWLQYSRGNWDTTIDIRTDLPNLTAWTPQYAYTTARNSNGLTYFIPVERKPYLPPLHTITCTRAIRDTFINNAPDNMRLDEAANIFDSWLDEQRQGQH